MCLCPCTYDVLVEALKAGLLVLPNTSWTSTSTFGSAEALGPLRILSIAVSSLHVLVPSLTLAFADTTSDGGTSAADDVWSARAESIFVNDRVRRWRCMRCAEDGTDFGVVFYIHNCVRLLLISCDFNGVKREMYTCRTAALTTSCLWPFRRL